MVCSGQKVNVAVKSPRIGASSPVTNSILKVAAKWLVYASTVTSDSPEMLFMTQNCCSSLLDHFVVVKR